MPTQPLHDPVRELDELAALLAELGVPEALQPTLVRVAQWVERHAAHVRCSVMLVRGDVLDPIATPSMPEAYRRAVADLPIAIGSGSCGEVAATGKPLLIADVSTHPNWAPHRALVAEVAITACWAYPMCSDGNVLGTLTLFPRGHGLPEESDSALAHAAARLAALAILRARETEKARSQAAELARSLASARTSEDSVRTLFRSTDQMMAVLDVDGTIKDIGWSAATATAIAPEAAVGLKFWELPTLTPLPEVQTNIEELIRRGAGGETVRSEFPFISPAGELRIARGVLTPLRDERGAVSRLLGEAIDITEQRRAEAELRESEAKQRDAARALGESERLFKQIAELSPDLIYIYDVAARRLRYVNPAAEEVIGWTPGELYALGSDVIPKLLAGDELADARARIPAEILRLGDEVHTADWPMRTRDGTLRTIEVRQVVFARDAQGKPQAILAVATDFGKRRALESRIRQQEKMESLGNLAGGIAHDFNNLLAVVLGNVEIARGLPAQSAATLALLTEVEAAAHRAKDLVLKILSFSRRSERAPRPIPLAKVVEESIRFARASLPSTIELVGTIEPVTVRADPTELQQVVLNLCANAASAMRERNPARIAIEVTRSLLDRDAADALGVAPGTYARLVVADTGIGIANEHLPRLFEPFFTTKPPGEGTGLGLSVVHGIVTASGGIVTVTSRRGEGATFTIWLPALPEDTPPTPPPPAPTANKSGRLLVVDDEEMVARMMVRLAATLGYQATSVNAPEEALALLAATPNDFDAMVVDLTMPGMTGDVLVAKARAIRPDIPAVICTGYAHAVDVDPEALGVEIIGKPLGRENLENALEAAKAIAARRVKG